MILLLSGDINLNPSPTQISKTWSIFKKRGLHFIHLNINSLPSEIEELRQIAKDTNSAVTGLSERKLDNTIFDSEISIPNYRLITVRKTVTEKAEVLHVISEAIFALIAKITYVTTLKIFLLTCYSRKQSLFLLTLYINFQLIMISWTTYIRDSMILIEWKIVFILGDTNIDILNNDEKISDKYKDMSERKHFRFLLEV